METNFNRDVLTLAPQNKGVLRKPLIPELLAR